MHTARVAPEKTDSFARPAAMSFAKRFEGIEMKMSYIEQLKHPNWQKKRLEMLSAANFECSQCGDKETTLHVHHKQYIKGRMAWEYEDSNFSVLCEDCHETTHDRQQKLNNVISLIPPEFLEDVIDVLSGYFGYLDPEIEAAHVFSPFHRRVGAFAYMVYSMLSLSDMDDLSNAFCQWQQFNTDLNIVLPKKDRSKYFDQDI